MHLLIDDPILVKIHSQFDTKLSNIYVIGTNIKIETIPEYLAKITSRNRFIGVPVTMLFPKQGYTPTPGMTYPVTDYKDITINFEVKYYSFIDGLADENFIEILLTNTEMSVTGNGKVTNKVKLVNDEENPAADKYYGTNEAGELGYHLLKDTHPPVTIADGSETILGLNGQEISITLPTVIGHNPVTIATESTSLASIDANQILTINPMHPPVTIADGSQSILGLNGQELSITIPPTHNPVTIDLGSTSILSLNNQVLSITLPVVHNPVTISGASTSLASIDENQILTINPVDTSKSYLGLTDTIDEDYVGKTWYVPRVVDQETDLILVPTEELQTVLAVFTLLADCPSSYPAGSEGMSVVVKQTLDGLEFANVTNIGNNHSPVTIATESAALASIDANQVLTINATSHTKNEYVALVSQVGTAAPTAITLEDGIGITSITRLSTGIYNFISNGKFTVDKTVPIDDVIWDQIGNMYILNWIDINTIQLESYAYTNLTIPSDDVLNKRHINFKVYL